MGERLIFRAKKSQLFDLYGLFLKFLEKSP